MTLDELLEITEPKKDLKAIIGFLERTDEKDWAVDVCITGNGGHQKCLLGHLYTYGGGDERTEEANHICDWFFNFWATTYMFFPVNDGKHPKYQQHSAKERCIAYLGDLLSGKELSSNIL